jgi:hypothetical protein
VLGVLVAREGLWTTDAAFYVFVDVCNHALELTRQTGQIRWSWKPIKHNESDMQLRCFSNVSFSVFVTFCSPMASTWGWISRVCLTLFWDLVALCYGAAARTIAILMRRRTVLFNATSCKKVISVTFITIHFAFLAVLNESAVLGSSILCVGPYPPPCGRDRPNDKGKCKATNVLLTRDHE